MGGTAKVRKLGFPGGNWKRGVNLNCLEAKITRKKNSVYLVLKGTAITAY